MPDDHEISADQMLRFRLCMFNENTGKWHATGYEELISREEFGRRKLPPTVHSLLTDGFSERGRINAIFAQDIPPTDSLDDLFSWLDEHSNQFGWPEKDEEAPDGTDWFY